MGREAKLGYLAHLLTENRHGFIVDTAVTAASGTAERDAALAMLGELPLTTRRLTVAADKAYDTRAWVAAVRQMHITPHVAQNAFGYGGSAIDARTTGHGGYRLESSQAEAGGASLRVAEDRGALPQAAASWRAPLELS